MDADLHARHGQALFRSPRPDSIETEVRASQPCARIIALFRSLRPDSIETAGGVEDPFQSYRKLFRSPRPDSIETRTQI